jgi:hypothetical protein
VGLTAALFVGEHYSLIDNVQDIVNSKDGQDIVYSVLGDVV